MTKPQLESTDEILRNEIPPKQNKDRNVSLDRQMNFLTQNISGASKQKSEILNV